MGDIVVPPSDAGDDLSTVVDSLSSWTGRSEGTMIWPYWIKYANRIRAGVVCACCRSSASRIGERDPWRYFGHCPDTIRATSKSSCHPTHDRTMAPIITGLCRQ
ncbi:hypothetical protein ID866_3814 [Astraeus odoratus]|nr:hypothetical protein ID866_3814 [Astraeus odoratus]